MFLVHGDTIGKYPFLADEQKSTGKGTIHNPIIMDDPTCSDVGLRILFGNEEMQSNATPREIGLALTEGWKLGGKTDSSLGKLFITKTIGVSHTLFELSCLCDAFASVNSMLMIRYEGSAVFNKDRYGLTEGATPLIATTLCERIEALRTTVRCAYIPLGGGADSIAFRMEDGNTDSDIFLPIENYLFVVAMGDHPLRLNAAVTDSSLSAQYPPEVVAQCLFAKALFMHSDHREFVEIPSQLTKLLSALVPDELAVKIVEEHLPNVFLPKLGVTVPNPKFQS